MDQWTDQFILTTPIDGVAAEGQGLPGKETIAPIIGALKSMLSAHLFDYDRPTHLPTNRLT